MKKLFALILALVPSKLPQGVAEFNAWADDLIELYNFPTADTDSIKFALASIIMHLGAQSAFKSKFYFYLTISAGAAKQVAGAVFYEIKTQQQAKQQAEAAAAKLQIVTDGPQQ